MLGSKNTSPQALAAWSALILAMLFALGSLLLRVSWVSFLVTLALVFLIVYAVLYYVIKQFIYRKIKLIYKFIFQTKASKKEDFFNRQILPQQSLEEVGLDVQQWAVQKRAEIENMERNEKFRKEFLLNLSHELKTPVFAIQSYIHTLLDGALEDAAVNRRFLEKTTKNIDRLCRLIEDVDEISRLESGEIPVTPEVFIIQDLVRDVFDSLSLKAQNEGIAFSIKKGCETPVQVKADKEKIRQVLINLLENSVKYGKRGGHTIASIYNMDEQQVLVELSDDGMGIAEEHLSRIFERFYRTDKARSRSEGGTGLGLAIVKHIVEAHGQTINVRSKQDVGSTFGFTLAAAKGD
jgi:two-component system phosphate regulon sensor histidine kinase PhoR